MKKNNTWKQKFIKLVAKEVGCSIQENGRPCNTCFHSWAENKLGLSQDVAHLFWIVVCCCSGYSCEESIEYNIDNFKEIVKNSKRRKYEKLSNHKNLDHEM